KICVLLPGVATELHINLNKPTLLASIISSTLMSGVLHAATTLDMAIVIDESGSMSGEHNAFIGTYVRHLDSMLKEQNVTLNQYGLVGFGGADRKSTRLNSSHVKISY